MTATQQQIQDAIVNHLADCEPCTLEEILEEVRIQCEVRRQILLPTVITAIAALQDAGKICEYIQSPLDDPLEYAWLLSEQRFS
jgi:hypothetical protein